MVHGRSKSTESKQYDGKGNITSHEKTEHLDVEGTKLLAELDAKDDERAFGFFKAGFEMVAKLVDSISNAAIRIQELEQNFVLALTEKVNAFELGVIEKAPDVAKLWIEQALAFEGKLAELVYATEQKAIEWRGNGASRRWQAFDKANELTARVCEKLVERFPFEKWLELQTAKINLLRPVANGNEEMQRQLQSLKDQLAEMKKRAEKNGEPKTA